MKPAARVPDLQGGPGRPSGLHHVPAQCEHHGQKHVALGAERRDARTGPLLPRRGRLGQNRRESLYLRGRPTQGHGRRSGRTDPRQGRRTVVRAGRRLGRRFDGQRMERRSGSGPRLRRRADRGPDRPALPGCGVRRPDARRIRTLEPRLPDQVRDRRRLHLYDLRQRFRSRRQGKVHLGGQRDRSVHGRRRIHRSLRRQYPSVAGSDPPRRDSRRNEPVFHDARPQRQPIPDRHGRIHRLRQSLRLDAPDPSRTAASIRTAWRIRPRIRSLP